MFNTLEIRRKRRAKTSNNSSLDKDVTQGENKLSEIINNDFIVSNTGINRHILT